MNSNELAQFWGKYAAQLLPLYKNTAATFHAWMYDFANNDVNDLTLRRSLLNLKLTSVTEGDSELIIIDLFLEDQEQDFFMGAIIGNRDGMIDMENIVTYNSNYQFEEYDCDGCKKTPVGAVCYHCEECNYDLCEECERTFKHRHEHLMLKNNACLETREFKKKDITARTVVELR